MNALTRALSAETLKMKGTLALWLTLLTPAALIFLEVAGASQYQGKLSELTPDINRWALFFEEVCTIWVILILPLFITLETALLGQLEHANDTWKVICTQPVPRRATLAAKQIWGLGLVALGMLALVALTLVGGGILDLVMPQIGIEPPIPWKDMFIQIGISFLAAGCIMAIHSWISLRSRSFVVASSIGIGMTIAGLILEGLMDWTDYFPWSMPSTVLYNHYQGNPISTYLWIGALSWVALSIVGNLDVGRVEVG